MKRGSLLKEDTQEYFFQCTNMRFLEEPKRSSQLNTGETSWAEKALPHPWCVNKLPDNLVLFVKHPKDA